MSPTDRYSKARGRVENIECRLCGMKFFNLHALAIHLKFSCDVMKYNMNQIRGLTSDEIT